MASSTPRPHFTRGKDPVSIVLQEAGWAPGPVWTGGKSRPHRDSIPDRPVRSSVAIPTELPVPDIGGIKVKMKAVDCNSKFTQVIPSYQIKRCHKTAFSFTILVPPSRLRCNTEDGGCMLFETLVPQPPHPHLHHHHHHDITRRYNPEDGGGRFLKKVLCHQNTVCRNTKDGGTTLFDVSTTRLQGHVISHPQQNLKSDGVAACPSARPTAPLLHR